MVNRRRTLVVLVGLLTLIVIAATLGVYKLEHRHATPKQAVQSTATNQSKANKGFKPVPDYTKLAEVIQGDDNPGSTYHIDSITQPVAGWFIVNVTMTNSYGAFKQIAVVEQKTNEDSEGLFDVIAGPGTSFPKTYLQSQGIPATIIDQLPTYNEDQ